MLQAEEGAHGQEQKNAVNFYVPCAKDASGEVHWQNLHKSLHQVSSAVNGRYEAFQKIEDAPRATKADNSFLEKLGITEGSLSEDDGDGYEYINGGHLWKTYAAKLSSSVSTLIVANTEGLWKRSNRGLLVKLLVGKDDMFESFVNNGEPMQTAMPTENEVSRLVIASEVMEGLHKFDGYRFEDEISVKYVQKGVGVRITGIWNEKVGYITDGLVDIFLVIDNEFNSAIPQAALIMGENARRMLIDWILVQREGAGLDLSFFMAIDDPWVQILRKREKNWELGSLAKQVGKNDLLIGEIEGSILTYSNEMVVKGDSLILSSIRDSSNSKLRGAEEFNFAYQWDKVREGLDSITQAVVFEVYTREHLMDLSLKPESVSNVKVDEKWLDGLHTLDGTVQQVVYTYILPMMQQQRDSHFCSNREHSGTKILFLLLAVKNRKMQFQVRELNVQKSGRYWEGRGARMKCKRKIMADSYHPP
ncbi:unnamed protein product [Cuscuta europaea]|uniref:Uncharacterized protein n=1 Tax=Cuscuta europaea TaxID=41803 RepID=A0A9P0Z1X4_CUSEU|nr:unnamed protein product [Cuscuta europaea]